MSRRTVPRVGLQVLVVSLPSRPASPAALDPQTLSRLAGGLAHELKNPLSTIGLHLDLLTETWLDEDDPRARRTIKTLEILRQEVGRLDDILHDFLAFARTDRIELADLDLNEEVERVVEFVSPEAQARGVQIRTFLDYDLPALPLDSGRLRQALLNLLINARQALEGSGGQVTVITRREGDDAVLEVVDDGPGMDAETLSRCFDVYFSSKKGGSGLGLPTVRRIAEAHGGSMELESSPRHGTRAVMRLPLDGRGPAAAEGEG